MDLNLDFDIGTKIVSVGDNLEDNLGFIRGDIGDLNEKTNNDTLLPNLNVSDGVELLSNNFGIKEEKKEENNDFSFFKVEDKGGIVDGDLKEQIDPVNDSFIMNNSDNDDKGRMVKQRVILRPSLVCDCGIYNRVNRLNAMAK